MYTQHLKISHLIILPCLFFLLVCINTGTFADSLVFEKLRINRARVNVIKADLNDPYIRIDIGLPKNGLAYSESFTSIVKRRMPLAAVTGTYFDTRSLLPVGTLIAGGKLIHRNSIGTSVYINSFNEIRFVNTRKGEICDMEGAESGIRTGPRLLDNGAYVLNPAREGFRDPGLFGSRQRIAMGVTSHNKLLLVAVSTPVTFGRLATILKKLGAIDAVCLDGGTSCAMYYDGRFICKPGRGLTNILEVHRRTAEEVAEIADRRKALNADVSAKQPDEYFAGVRTELIIRPVEIYQISYRRLNQIEVKDIGCNENALLPENVILALSKGRHSLFPIHRTKLTGLKGFKNPKNLVNIPPNVKIMHYLVS